MRYQQVFKKHIFSQSDWLAQLCPAGRLRLSSHPQATPGTGSMMGGRSRLSFPFGIAKRDRSPSELTSLGCREDDRK